MKFFDIKIDLNDINKEQSNNIEDLEIVLVNTFGDLVDKVNNNIEGSPKNIKNITFKGKKSSHKVLNLSFDKCKFINYNIDINKLIEEEKINKDEDLDEDSNSSF